MFLITCSLTTMRGQLSAFYVYLLDLLLWWLPLYEQGLSPFVTIRNFMFDPNFVAYRPLLPAAITVSSFHFNLLLTFHQVKGSYFDTVSVCLVTTHIPAVSWFCLHLAWVSSDLCLPPTRHQLYNLCTWSVTDNNLYRWTSPHQRWSPMSDLSAFPSSFLPDIVITSVIYWLM